VRVPSQCCSSYSRLRVETKPHSLLYCCRLQTRLLCSTRVEKKGYNMYAVSRGSSGRQAGLPTSPSMPFGAHKMVGCRAVVTRFGKNEGLSYVCLRCTQLSHLNKHQNTIFQAPCFWCGPLLDQTQFCQLLSTLLPRVESPLFDCEKNAGERTNELAKDERTERRQGGHTDNSVSRGWSEEDEWWLSQQ